MNKSLGQICFEIIADKKTEWTALEDHFKQKWENAANAVVAAHENSDNPEDINILEIGGIINCPKSSTGKARVIGIDPCPNPNIKPWHLILEEWGPNARNDKIRASKEDYLSWRKV